MSHRFKINKTSENTDEDKCNCHTEILEYSLPTAAQQFGELRAIKLWLVPQL